MHPDSLKTQGEIDNENGVTDDGGPAFPVTPHFEWNDQYGINENKTMSGMSLRDWFAGQALAGMNANPDLMEWVTADKPFTDLALKLAQAAYIQADAMLTGRERG